MCLRFRVEYAGRVHNHRVVSGRLSALDDDGIRKLLSTATPLGSGIGGTCVRLDVDDVPVFAKRIPLGEVEARRPGSTANIFDLPAYCHYGIGSPGFGAWREVAASEMLSQWVLDRYAHCFPLAYGGRIVPMAETGVPADLDPIDDAVRYWNGSEAVRIRIETLATARTAVALFLEYIPCTVEQWLNDRLAEGIDAAERACLLVEDELHALADLMSNRQFVHLDAHFENLLTDGKQLYLADPALAVTPAFDMTSDERAFLERHRAFDRSYMAAQLVRWITQNVGDATPGLARIVDRYRPVVEVARSFYAELQSRSRLASYPVREERDAWRQVCRSNRH